MSGRKEMSFDVGHELRPGGWGRTDEARARARTAMAWPAVAARVAGDPQNAAGDLLAGLGETTVQAERSAMLASMQPAAADWLLVLDALGLLPEPERPTGLCACGCGQPRTTYDVIGSTAGLRQACLRRARAARRAAEAGESR